MENRLNSPQRVSWLVEVARIELAPEVLEDFDRILDPLANYQVENPEHRIAGIISALDVLVFNPLIGRPGLNGKRELVIGSHTRGYVALYRFVAEMDILFVLAIRGQREAGYAPKVGDG